MKKSEEKQILRNIRNEQEWNVLDFTDDMSIQVTIRKINPGISFVVSYLHNFKEEMLLLERDIATIRDDGDKKAFLKKMKKLLLDNELYKQEKVPRKKKTSTLALKHSVTWYLYNRVDNEIIKIENRIEGLNGIIKAVDNLGKVLKIIKDSNSPDEAVANLMQKQKFSELEARSASKMTLEQLDSKKVLAYIEYLNSIKSLLLNLKS
jgi:hypothetical protein